jgi:hypothetical protein
MAEKIFKQFTENRKNDFKSETGLNVPEPKELLRDKSVFEKMEVHEVIEISPGIQLEKGSIVLDSIGSFVNYYDISIESSDKNVTIDLFSVDTPLHLKRILQNDEDIIAITNGGYFYLADESDYHPKNANYQLNIRNGEICSLPVADRPFLFIKDGEIHVKEIAAHGTLTVDGVPFYWKGSKSNSEASVVLYTSASSVIKQVSSLSTGSKRVSVPVQTPNSQGVVDVVIVKDSNNIFIVDKILNAGEGIVQENVGILQMPAHNVVKKGSIIKIADIDGLDLSSISSGFCIGLNVFYFLEHNDHEINHDLSLGDNQPLGQNRIARNVVYKDLDNKIHTRLFDGVPGSVVCSGITPKEVASIFEKLSVEWAYHLDGGQSAKLVTREKHGVDLGKEFKSYGNKHYVRWPKNDSHPFLWDPDGGRKVPSGIVFKRINNKHNVIDSDSKYIV